MVGTAWMSCSNGHSELNNAGYYPGHFDAFDEMDDSNDPNSVARIWPRLVKTALWLDLRVEYDPGNNYRPVISSFYADWLKTWRCVDVNFPQHNIRALEHHINSCFVSFSQFGYSLGFRPREERTTIRCAYPRCPAAAFESDPQFLCARCLNTPYCSHLCQIK